jgi:hypothetical protein
MTTSDKISIFALGISIFTAIYSWFTFSKTDELSRNAFNRNYRPYVNAASYSYLKDGRVIPQMSVIGIKVYNAPALMTFKHLRYFIKSSEGDSLLFDELDSTSQLIYPIESSETIMTTSDTIINEAVAKSIAPKELVRRIWIEYRWISDTTSKYFYQSVWTDLAP